MAERRTPIAYSAEELDINAAARILWYEARTNDKQWSQLSPVARTYWRQRAKRAHDAAVETAQADKGYVRD